MAFHTYISRFYGNVYMQDLYSYKLLTVAVTLMMSCHEVYPMQGKVFEQLTMSWVLWQIPEGQM